VEERGVLPRRLVITPHELEFDVREGDVRATTRRGDATALVRDEKRTKKKPKRFATDGLAPAATRRLFRTASATYDPLCEFINPMLDEENRLNCGGDYA